MSYYQDQVKQLQLSPPRDREHWAIGDGWVPFVAKVVEALGANNYTVTQVKEKFGGLRIYYQPCDDIGDALVEVAEIAAMHTCEACGAPAESTRAQQPQGYWVKTLCASCHAERDQAHAKLMASKES